MYIWVKYIYRFNVLDNYYVKTYLLLLLLSTQGENHSISCQNEMITQS